MKAEGNRRYMLWRETPPAGPQVDLEVLGAGIKRIPLYLWEERMFFLGARDRLLLEFTRTFPRSARPPNNSHPVFVLQTTRTLGHRVCPCSSKGWEARRFIEKGCLLEITDNMLDRNSYLVESCAFNLPDDPAFGWELIFFGLVPEKCIKKREEENQ